MPLTDFLSMSSRLASLNRFSMERLTHPESVLEHTGFVVLASAFLAYEVNSKIKVEHDRIDAGYVLSKALAHDLDELVLGDIPRPTKYSVPEAKDLFDRLKATAIKKAVSPIADEFPTFAGCVESDHAKAKTSFTGCLVAIADLMAVVYMIWREVIVRSNFSMIRYAYTTRDQIEVAKARVIDQFALRSPETTNTRDAAGSFLLSVLTEMTEICQRVIERDHHDLATGREDK